MGIYMSSLVHLYIDIYLQVFIGALLFYLTLIILFNAYSSIEYTIFLKFYFP